MILGRVTGTVVSTAKHEAYLGKKLLIVQPIDAEGNDAGEEFLAVDRVQAGDGDRVIVLIEGNGVRQLFNRTGTMFPILETIVGVVDMVEGEA